MAEIIWNEVANNSLAIILSYGRREFGEKAANNLYTKLQKTILLLKTNPRLGSIEVLFKKNSINSIRSISFHNHYKIIYKLTKHGADLYICIVDIWDTRANPTMLTDRIDKYHV